MATKIKNITRIRMITNGLALTPELVNKLAKAGITEINVSLDATDRETYEKMNRVDGFNTVVAHINHLSKVARKNDIKSDMKVTLYKNDQEQIKKFKVKFERNFDRIRFTNLHHWLGLRGKQKKVAKNGPCPHPFYQMQILWDGQITLCCNDSMEGFINMGNIMDISMKDYWKNSPQMTAIRKALIKDDLKDFPVCDACDIHLYEVEKEFFKCNNDDDGGKTIPISQENPVAA